MSDVVSGLLSVIVVPTVRSESCLEVHMESILYSAYGRLMGICHRTIKTKYVRESEKVSSFPDNLLLPSVILVIHDLLEPSEHLYRTAFFM